MSSLASDLARASDPLPWLPSILEIKAELAQIRNWDREFQVPDVVGFADYAKHPEEIQTQLSSRHAVGPRGQTISTFASALAYPYPKPTRGHRIFTLVDPCDRVLYRCLVGRVVQKVDSALGHTIFANRLKKALQGGP